MRAEKPASVDRLAPAGEACDDSLRRSPAISSSNVSHVCSPGCLGGYGADKTGVDTYESTDNTRGNHMM
eukprot:SAG22_NODE_17967_length_295_cov_1.489796_1_plen_68_part_01